MGTKYKETFDTLEPNTKKLDQRNNPAIDVEVYVTRTEQNLPGLLLDIPPDVIPAVNEWPDFKNFDITTEQRQNEHEQIRVELQDEEFQDVFLMMAEHLCEVMFETSITNEAELFQAFQNTLNEWKELLKTSRGKLSRSHQVGLYGELWLLKNILLEHLDASDAVQSWRGHTRAAQDFQRPEGFGIEVKTTSENVPSGFNISNAQQLDDSSFQGLFIALVQVNQNRAAGQSLNDLVDELLEQLDSPTHQQFQRALMRVGYDKKHKDHYKDLYHFKTVEFYQVKEGFPRLIRGESIPEGIKEVSYKVSTDACNDFKVHPEKVTEFLLRNPES